jgi:transposase
MKKPKAVPPQVKFQAALEAIKGEKSLVELARIYNVHPNTIVKWKAELMEKGATLFSNETQEKELEKKIRDLEQLIGKKEVEIALLKNFRVTGRGDEADDPGLRASIDLAREALAQGLAPLPIVLSALEIPRATWYYYRKQKVEADRKREEEERRLKRAIEEILLEHPEYGYRRVTEELHVRKG